MDARLFRYLFENTSNAIVMSGCTWDKGMQEQVRYVYTCEMSHNSSVNCCQGVDKQMLYSGSPVKFFVLGSFSIEDAKRFIHAMRYDTVDIVILPYVAPIQRFLMIQSLLSQGIHDNDVIDFIRAPYLYLKESCVKRFIFIYGNGEALGMAGSRMYPGYHFEMQDEKILDVIEDMEGYRIPVMKAGYIIDNRMLFYFGHFGVDLRMIRHFVFHYAKSGQIDKFDGREYQKMLLLFRKEFSVCGMDTLTMFCSPTEIIASRTDCVLNTIVIDREDFCHADIEGDEGRCTIKCMLYNDYDVCHCHRTEDAELRAGVLLLGNIRLSKHLEQFRKRYQVLEQQIRAISIPNCGNIYNWESGLADINAKKNAVFWVCPLHAQMPDRVLREIKSKNARYRIIGLNEEYGCCINGFLTEKAP